MIIEFKKNYKFYLSYLVLMTVLVGVSLYLYFTNEALSVLEAFLYSASFCIGFLYLVWYTVMRYQKNFFPSFLGILLVVFVPYGVIITLVTVVHSAINFAVQAGWIN